MPPEWARHARCWMAWPCNEALWGDRLAAARRAYAEVAGAIAAFEPVTMIARPGLTAEASLHCGQGISILPLDHDDSWTRDTAPTFLLGPEGVLAGVDWRYDGYGGRTATVAQDQQLAEAVCRHLKIERFRAPLVLEGGGLHVDGDGTALVCAASVLDPRRNAGLGRAEAETLLQAYLGVEKVIWLEAGLVDDDTGGHVDNLACFARPGVVLALVASDPDEANAPALAANLEILKAATDARGRSLKVIEIQEPKPALHDDGRRLSRSYINFYLANDAVIMPIFNESTDQPAYRAISQAFEGREVVEVDASDLVHGGGSIHCITQQQPG
jgi:agmatine deiminase